MIFSYLSTRVKNTFSDVANECDIIIYEIEIEVDKNLKNNFNLKHQKRAIEKLLKIKKKLVYDIPLFKVCFITYATILLIYINLMFCMHVLSNNIKYDHVFNYHCFYYFFSTISLVAGVVLYPTGSYIRFYSTNSKEIIRKNVRDYSVAVIISLSTLNVHISKYNDANIPVRYLHQVTIFLGKFTFFEWTTFISLFFITLMWSPILIIIGIKIPYLKYRVNSVKNKFSRYTN